MRTVQIAAYRYRHEGEFARAVLQAMGIEAMIIADDVGGMEPYIMTVNPVRVYVREEDVDSAIQALRNANETPERDD